jgi:hypothetical protein
LATFGGGRARPEWAERIGKKYQWIAFYRLLGRLADHTTKKRYSSDPPPPTTPDLQAASNRNIDPTLLLKRDRVTAGTSWWASVGYDFEVGGVLDDSQWLDLADLPDSSQMLVQRDPVTGGEWVILESYRNWSSLREDDEDRYPYRSIWMHIRSYLVKQCDARPCWEWIQQQRFMGGWMPQGFELHGIHVGEYPDRMPARQFFEEAQSWTRGEGPIPFDLLPTANDLSSDHSFDAYQQSLKSMLVPSETFFSHSALRWDGISNYVNPAGQPCFRYPAATEEGPQALLVDKQYLLDYLKGNRFVLVWTVLAEKQCILGMAANSLGWLEHSRAHILRRTKITSSQGITERKRPGLAD